MSRVSSFLSMVMTISIISLWSTVAQAGGESGHKIYFVPMLSYVKADSDRLADDNVGVQLGVGSVLSKKWNLELSMAFDNLDFESGAGKFKQKGIIVDGLYFFERSKAFQTFGLIGAGFMNTKVPAKSSTNPLANVGIGFLYDIVDTDIDLRADVRYRMDMDDESVAGQDRFSDWLFSVGVVVPFGGTKETKTNPVMPSQYR